jgi:exonuclease III
MDMRFGTWNVKSLCRAGSLVTVSNELSKYKLDLVGVQEVRWVGGHTETSRRIHNFSMVRRIRIMN